MKKVNFLIFASNLLAITAGATPAISSDQAPRAGESQPAVECPAGFYHKAPPYKSCPDTKYIDCMPIVPAERRWMCEREYLDWVKKNCPGVKVTR